MYEDLTLLAMARKDMDWLTRRQEVLAQNVANANTPKYQSKDIAPLDFKSVFKNTQAPLQAEVTNPMHIQPPVEQAKYESDVVKQPAESKPDGNSVSLEDQMQKIGEVKNNYDLAINLLQKNIKMIKTALGQGSSS
ncbi:MAG TPA: flagellar basal body rod protein FlgB [Candidatus Sulfotelmatobacter sp.]|nr:flagellar basal body rod protein FlgB [Candidatus Sulfotelmatobacter sp.]